MTGSFRVPCLKMNARSAAAIARAGANVAAIANQGNVGRVARFSRASMGSDLSPLSSSSRRGASKAGMLDAFTM
jgi:hypothetical protein